MLEIIFIFIALFLLFFAFTYRNSKSSFDITEEAVYFHQIKKQISYTRLVSIERDMSTSFQGKTMYFPYIITFYDENGQINSFRFQQALTDQKKWNDLKAKILASNQAVKINESIL